MSPCHAPSPSSAATPSPSPISIEEEGNRDLEAIFPSSTVTSAAEEAEPPPARAPTDQLGASTPPHASRRRGGGTQAEEPLHGRVLLPCIDLTALACHTGVEGGDDVASGGGEFPGNGEGGAAQARQVVIDGGAHVVIDMAALRQAAALAGAPTDQSESQCGTLGNKVASDRKVKKHSAAKQKYAKVLLSLFGVCLSTCSAAFPVVKQHGAPDGYVILAYGLLVVLALVLLVGLLATSFDGSPSSVVWGKYALQLALGLTIGFLTWSVCSLEPKLVVPIGIAGALAYVVVVLLFHRRKW